MRALVAILALAIPSVAAARETPWDKSGIDWKKTPELGAEPTYKPPRATESKLANGVSLVVVENKAVPIASIRVVVAGAGSAADPIGKTGLAALTADMMDEGAGGLSALALANEVDRLGSSLRIWGDVDGAFVHATSLARNLDRTLELAAKVITAPAFDDKEFGRVHGDVKTDLVLRRDQPYDVAALVFATALRGPTAPYGHPPAGTLADVEALTAADVKDFYARAWRPSSVTVVVSGDVDAKKVAATLEKHLGAWNPTTPAPVKEAIKAVKHTPPRLAVVDRVGAAQTALFVGMVGVPRSDARFHAIEVLGNALGGSFTSRLNRRLREQLGYTYGIRGGMRYMKTSGVFLISSGIFTPKTGPSMEEITKIVADLGKKDMPAAELDKTKFNLIRQLPQSFESNDGIVGEYAGLALYGLPPTWYDDYADKIRGITAAQLRKLAKSLIPTSKLTWVIVGDWKTIEKDVGKLKLGKPAMYDPDGKPVVKK